MKIRAEHKNDYEKVYLLNTSAFETHGEAELVNILRDKASPIISIVCEQQEEIIGHILFTPVVLDTQPSVKIMGLAPMAVTPEKQNSGIGSKLVEAGLEQCRKLGYPRVVVLGHPNYYPKFGFVPASKFQITSEYEVPDEVFMAAELEDNAFNGCQGKVKYHEAFNNV